MNIQTEFSIGDPIVFIAGSAAHYSRVASLTASLSNLAASTLVVYKVKITSSDSFETGSIREVNEDKMAKDKPSLMHKL